ncbi:MAG TPA: pitrilysin family protein [Candidatus Mcinerneyibacteriales bacterium]|nr:pitrilysin family protein [Candidatus Mcinerneyibacteriales bacterium]
MIPSGNIRDLFVLENGLAVGYERIPSINSFNIGIFFRIGSFHEPEHLNGITHVIEHLLFKRTRHYTNRELVYKIEGLGGDYDAFTGYDGVTVTLRILNRYWKEAIQLLYEIIREALFLEEDFRAEKKVILEEIEMYRETPQDAIMEMLTSFLWQGSPLGRPILGTEQSLEGLTARQARDYFHAFFTAANATLSVAGEVDPGELKEALKIFESLPTGKKAVELSRAPEQYGLKYQRNSTLRQAHLVLYFPAVDHFDKRRYAFFVLNALLGAADFSMFNQELRESRGLAYNLYSDLILFPGNGVFYFYAGFNPSRLEEVEEGLRGIFSLLKKDGISPELLTIAKNYVLSKLVFSLDIIYNIMEKNGTFLRRYGEFPDFEQTKALIEDVTLDDIRALIRDFIFSGECGLVYYGKNRKKDVEETWKKLQSEFSAT